MMNFPGKPTIPAPLSFLDEYLSQAKAATREFPGSFSLPKSPPASPSPNKPQHANFFPINFKNNKPAAADSLFSPKSGRGCPKGSKKSRPANVKANKTDEVKKRGRLKKNTGVEKSSVVADTMEEAVGKADVVKKRGRPKKNVGDEGSNLAAETMEETVDKTNRLAEL
ncbi:MAG: hypothetical protein Q9208_007847 [Pyrenodesmia sp. 3 TL-2023]